MCLKINLAKDRAERGILEYELKRALYEEADPSRMFEVLCAFCRKEPKGALWQIFTPVRDTPLYRAWKGERKRGEANEALENLAYAALTEHTHPFWGDGSEPEEDPFEVVAQIEFQVWCLHEKGKDAKAIAHELGMAQREVSRILKRRHYTTRQVVYQDAKKEAIRLANEGFSVRHIAKLLEVPKSTVSDWTKPQ